MVYVQAFRGGDSRALDKFYLNHRREFIQWADKAFRLDMEEAMDIYQDAILILYENIKKGKISQLNASLKTYFFGIGKNLILKKIARKKAENNCWPETYRRAESELLLELNCQEENEEALVAGLAELSKRNQSILKLYYYHQLPLKDIAQQLGYDSVDVVKNQKVRCMKYLKKLLEDKLVCAY